MDKEIVTLKKSHPCSSKSQQFYVLQIDGEVRLKCVGCGGIVLLKRGAYEKAIKKMK